MRLKLKSSSIKTILQAEENNLLIRVIVSVIFAPILLWISLSPSFVGWIIWGLISAVAVGEWVFMARRYSPHSLRKWMLVLLQGIVLLFGVVWLTEMADPHSVFYKPSELGEGKGHLLFLVLIITWAVDTGAYFGGRVLAIRDAEGRPKHPLSSVLSPNKSWEGALVGWISGVLTGAVATLLLGHSFFAGGLVGAFLGATGQAGDLLESALKRSVTLKDSGLLPGHGGILDRFDAFLANIAVVGLFLAMAARFHWGGIAGW